MLNRAACLVSWTMGERLWTSTLSANVVPGLLAVTLTHALFAVAKPS